MLLTYSRLGSLRFVLGGIGLAVGLFLLLPILVLVALSFGDSQWMQFPPPGWTLRWYAELLDDPDWIFAFLTSLRIAAWVTVLSVLLGLAASFGLVRGRFPGREAVRALFLMPMILPVVVLAVALYALFLRLQLNGTETGFVLAHLLLALPFSVIAISGALERFDPAIEDAAVLCGASPLEAKLCVTLPGIMPGIATAALFSFLASWDEVVVAIFMASPDIQTLPVRIWGVLRQDLSPVVAAVSTLLVALTAVLMLLSAALKKKDLRA
ncbi:ABC transporter permease [Methylobacterium organophilum]|uniref:2-aminoethylphosphonate transport system permease protein PhnV n=1 Tax=Methylobacterium organophilum TaxID=410 RepID=A0ABQ4T7P8_METOR|nr:ABC transporter permease [Methylobacterium organophilum]GJE27676.1 Putative 2-aminoethylphosphonate transport system permease protein PhnV [Methylobacterium organophilum]